MKLLRRSTLAAGLLALSLAPFGAVRADSLLEVTGTMLGGPQFETYTFEITQAGTDYVANLLDYLFPTDAFAYLGLAITQGAEVLGSIHGSGSFTFSADAAGTYTALVFGVPQGPFEAGSYGISIESIQAAQVPEAQSWALLVMGLGLLGMKARMRKVSAMRLASR